MLSRFAGRKSVILFSEGLAVSPRMDGVLSQAQDENVTFYTLDAPASAPAGRKSLPRRDIDPSELTGSSDAAPSLVAEEFPEMDPTSGLGPLADRTGGVYVSDTNDLTRRRCRRSTRTAARSTCLRTRRGGKPVTTRRATWRCA